jgi:hypothetical protein
MLGCSGSNTTVGPVAKVVVSPTTLSLNVGEVSQVTGTPEDARGNAVFTATVTYSVSPNPGPVDVSATGLVCAGKWDSLTNPINCTPGSTGTATITAATTANGGFSATVPVSVHEHVDVVSVQAVSPPAAGCVSQGATAPANSVQYQATALSTNPAVCAGLGASTPCTVPGVGNPIWTTDQPTVANLANQPSGQAANLETVTAGAPGLANIFASVSNVVSTPAAFTTCPAATISTHLSGSQSTSVTLSGTASQQLTADVLDTQGVKFTSITLSWNSSQPHVANAGGSGVVTAVSPGTSSISSACTPPLCNIGLNPIYGNLVNVTVSGTSSQTVYVTTTATPAAGTSTLLVPIVNNAAGTPISLPADTTVNSMLLNPLGTAVYLGTDKGLTVLNPTTSTAAPPVTSLTGKVLAISPDGNHLIISDANNPTPSSRLVYIYNTANGTLDATLSIPNATAAQFSPDNFKAFIVGGNTLYIWSSKLALRTVNLGGTGSDVSVLPSGHVAFAASQVGDNVVAVCNNQVFPTINTGAPLFIGAVPNATGAVDVTNSAVDQFDVAVSSGCPPSFTNSAPSAYAFAGIGSFTPFQLLMTPDSSRAVVISDKGVLIYHIGATATGGSTSAVSLPVQPTMGAVTLDSTTVYVGATDSTVHVIDLTGNGGAGTDKQSISVSVRPDLVAVRPQ